MWTALIHDPADNDRNAPEAALDPSRSYALPIDVKMVNGVAATAIRSEGQYPTIKDRAVFSSTALFLWGATGDVAMHRPCHGDTI